MAHHLAKAMRRLCIFAHYDAGGQVRRYVRHFLHALRGVCDELHFVSTAALPEAELASLRPLCARAYTRANEGFDFGMWQDALRSVDLATVDELVLTNSSIFGPVGSLETLFARMADVEADVWGGTENFDIARHLQSYFLVFRRPVLRAPAFQRFWDSVLLYRDKDQVIRSYEVGLSRFLAEHGFRVVPAVSFDKLWCMPEGSDWLEPLYRLTGNASCRFPSELVERGLPFVKVEALRDNPMKTDLQGVRATMRAYGYDLSLIEFDRPSKKRKR
jgi:lipopolysaccharide biosynthesis protein